MSDSQTKASTTPSEVQPRSDSQREHRGVFAIRFVAAGTDGWTTHVSSPCGEVTSTFALPPAFRWLNNQDEGATGTLLPAMGVVRGLRRLVTGQDERTPQQIGEALFRALFTPAVRSLFDRSLGRLDGDPRGLLPIQLRFDLTQPAETELARLPWELLYHPEQQQFLTHSEQTPVVRYLTPEKPVPDFELPARLRILVVAASPSDQEALALANEVQRIRTTWNRDDLEVIVLEHADQTRLRRALQGRDLHVLHFMGHGHFDPIQQEGQLILESEDGHSDKVASAELAAWLRNHRSLRLVVLNACSSGQIGTGEPFAGVAAALVKAGVPGVVAMRRPMPDGRAIQFTEALYTRMAAGHPVEAAIATARTELAAIDGASDVWSTPILLARTAAIFHLPPNIGPALSKIWTALGFALFYFSLSALLRSTQGPELPSPFSRVHHLTVPVFGILFGAPLILLLLYVITLFQRGVREFGWLARLPVTLGLRLQSQQSTAQLCQGIFLTLFLLFPLYVQGHLFKELVQQEVWRKDDKSFVAQGLTHFTKKHIPFLAIFNEHSDDYRMGPKVRTERKEDEHFTDAVTFFPFWQPWIFLLLELYVVVMFIKVWRKTFEGSLEGWVESIKKIRRPATLKPTAIEADEQGVEVRFRTDVTF